MSGSVITQILAESGGAFTPVQHLYVVNGSGTETIPAGSTTVDVECWGATGTGGAGNTSGGTQGGGGGSGGYSHSQYNVAGSAGLTFTYVVGKAAVSGSSVANGTFGTAVNMTAPLGGNGGAATLFGGGTGGVAGAVGTGGTVATRVGNAGDVGDFPGDGLGGTGVVGMFATGKAGGFGHYAPSPNPGADGIVLFQYA